MWHLIMGLSKKNCALSITIVFGLLVIVWSNTEEIRQMEALIKKVLETTWADEAHA